MYVYDFKPKQKGINFREIFVVMPFGKKYDGIYKELIVPATEKANKRLNYTGSLMLYPYRTIDDIRTTSGWINVLEHLLTAQIVLGVLTSDNPNVFYELGIAHATEPITRQILMANRGYKPKFDLKDLIYYEYEESNLEICIEPLAAKIEDAIKTYKIGEEKKIRQTIMLIGPYEFEILGIHGQRRNFVIPTPQESKDAYEKTYGVGTLEKHITGITNLCHHGLLGFNTKSSLQEGRVVIEVSYHWTSLGNDVLLFQKLITEEELKARRENLPRFFEQ